MDQDLLVECADWVAAQMEEEGYLIDAELIQLVLETERAAAVSVTLLGHDTAAARLLEELEAAGVRGVPNAVDGRLLRTILEWEDEFLALAGQPR